MIVILGYSIIFLEYTFFWGCPQCLRKIFLIWSIGQMTKHSTDHSKYISYSRLWWVTKTSDLMIIVKGKCYYEQMNTLSYLSQGICSRQGSQQVHASLWAEVLWMGGGTRRANIYTSCSFWNNFQILLLLVYQCGWWCGWKKYCRTIIVSTPRTGKNASLIHFYCICFVLWVMWYAV